MRRHNSFLGLVLSLPVLIVLVIALVVLFGGLSLLTFLITQSAFTLVGIVVIVFASITGFRKGFTKPILIVMGIGAGLLVMGLIVPALRQATLLSILG